MDYHEVSKFQKVNYRKSGFMLAGILSSIYMVLSIQGEQQPYLLVVAAGLFIAAYFNMKYFNSLIDFLIRIGNIMHMFTNPLILGFLYIVIVVPTSLMLKLAGKDILQLDADSQAASYWQDRKNGKSWQDFFSKQF